MQPAPSSLAADFADLLAIGGGVTIVDVTSETDEDTDVAAGDDRDIDATPPPAPRYRYIGTTDDQVVCDNCGRRELGNTVVLATLDADGNDDGITYFGSTCAARALATPGGGREVLRSARYATVATLRAAQDAHRRADLHTRFARFNDDGALEWDTRYGVAVLGNARAGVGTAVDRVAAIRELAAPIADAAVLGYPTAAAVEHALRAGGWL